MQMRKLKWMLIILISFILIPLLISIASSASANSNADEWPMYRHDLDNTGYTTDSGPTNLVKLLWNFTTMKSIASSPTIANDCVFVGSKDGALYCLNSSNGGLLWYFYSKGSEVNSSPTIYNNSIYVGVDNGNVYNIEIATGKIIWTTQVGGLMRSCPAIAEGRVYVGSGNNDFFCLNASDGSVIWTFPTLYRVQSSPAVSEGVIYFATDDFHTYALNASTGSQIWRTHTGSVFSSPAVCNGYLYIGSIDGYLWSLNASTGDKIWGYQTENSVASSAAIAYGYVYVGCDDNNVYCLNASNGEKIWQSPTGYWVRSSPAVADGNVYVGSDDYNIYCFDAFTGAKKWSYETRNYVDSSPAIVNGTLFVGSCDNRVYAFTVGDSTDFIPSQSTNSLSLTNIVFDVLACAIAASVIFLIARFVTSSRVTKQNAEWQKIAVEERPWLLEHINAICILAIFAFSTIFFVNLGSGPLWAADEQTYSQLAFNMLKTGDYLTLQAFGGLAMWIGKPPLFMWLMSLAYQVFGVNNFASRFWSAVFGTLSLILVFYLGKKLYNLHVGFISAIVLGTFTTFYTFARHAMLDITFVLFILASIYFLFLSENSESTNQYAALSGVFFGLAFLTKQVVALLVPLIAFAYFIATRRSIKVLFTKRFARFWQMTLLMVVPWLIYMILRFGPVFWDAFFVYSGAVRAVNPIEGHAESYLFYFNYLLNSENLVWIILLPLAAGLCAFNAVIRRSKEDTLILVWMAIVLAMFTFIQTKLYWYILPAFPAFAIAISNLLHQLIKRVQLAVRWLSSKALTVFEVLNSFRKQWKQRQCK
jgi:outer membrane protein assembly factor BamB